jgi:hypothetical protein
MHKCTEQDWAKFYQPSKNHRKMINDFKDKAVAFCPDDNDMNGKPFWTPENKRIFSNFGSEGRFLSMSLYKADDAKPEDSDNYLFPPFTTLTKMKIIHNYEQINFGHFNNESVKKQSKFFTSLMTSGPQK